MTENHKERKHALLSASGASRWMNCTPSARLEESLNIKEEESVFAAEGTLAHEFGDVVLTRHLKKITPKKYEARLEGLRAHDLYTDDMEDYVDIYTDYVTQEFKAAKKKDKFAELLVEEKVNLTEYIEEGFGTNDAMIITDGTLEVIDLKYGKGVRVDSDNNSQLMLYGLGALDAFSFLYEIHTVKLTIVQPRLNHISTWTISADELLKWGEHQVKTKAKQAYAGEGLQCAGDWCRWCKVKPQCATLASQNMKVARHEFADPKLLKKDQLVDIYRQTSQINDWLKSVSEFMLKSALAGTEYKGLKVVEGKSMRKWGDAEKIKETLIENDFTAEQFTVSKLAGIGAIEKLVGKKEFPAMFSGLVLKLQGKPTLVDAKDVRPPFQSAADDFS